MAESQKPEKCRCPYCDAVIPEQAGLCVMCRMTIVECVHCGEPVREGVETCPHCGEPQK